ncbi:MAG: serine/threonine protein kinase [Kofleriaceae bacterium]|nr:serine/threonine protein kinase [Kofleriaceae bacterium]
MSGSTPSSPGESTADDLPATADELGSMASVLRALAEAPGGGGPTLAAGQVVADKYRIERVLGRGGMGVVYLARDLRLGRDVALKLARAAGPEALARALREAQALARLAHPNVVTMYEVGEVDGALFLAMEHVGGGTARTWLAEATRTPAQIIALYCAAGDGLAAAHAAGLVHRDVKPDNVLVGRDGRARVADFGLAQLRAGADRAATPADDAALEAGPGDTTGTDADSARRRALAVAGTPAYMAPEQRAGHAIDGRADQYALCASLWEALGGDRPAPPTDVSTVPAATGRTSRPAPAGRAPTTTTVPAHVVAALQRGLAIAPAERWPDLASLVRELRRDPAARRRRLAIGGGVAVAAAAAAVLVTRAIAPAGASPCAGAAAQVTRVFPSARADALGARFATARADVVWARLRGQLERYADALGLGQRDACQARAGDDPAADALSARRDLCLSAALARFEVTLRRLEAAPPDRLIEADAAMANLPDLAGCGALALANQIAVPADPARRVLVAEARPLVAEALTATDDPDGRALAARALAAARAGGWAPQEAEAQRALGHLERMRDPEAARAAYREAVRLALESGSDEQAAWMMADLAWIEAEEGPPAEAARWLELASALWVRLGQPGQLGVRLSGAATLQAVAAGDGARALTTAGEHAARSRAVYGDDPVEESATLANLGQAQEAAGDLGAAGASYQRGLALAEQALGPDHPAVGRHALRLAAVNMRRGDADGAVTLARRALTIHERWYQADDGRLAYPLTVLAGLLAQTGSPEAKVMLERTMAAQAAAGGPDLARTQANLAIVEIGAGDFTRALALGHAALGVLEDHYGGDHLELINTLILIAYAHREGQPRDLDAARAAGSRAVAIASARRGEAHPETINTRVELATTLLAAGQRDQARAALAPALVAIASHPDLPPGPVAEARALDQRLRGR